MKLKWVEKSKQFGNLSVNYNDVKRLTIEKWSIPYQELKFLNIKLSIIEVTHHLKLKPSLAGKFINKLNYAKMRS